MRNIREKIISRLPSIIATKDGGFLKLNFEQKEALAARLELFFQLELSNAQEEGKQEARSQLPAVSMN